MTIWWLGCILGVLAAAAIAFIWVAVRLGSAGSGGRKNIVDDFAKAAEDGSDPAPAVAKLVKDLSGAVHAARKEKAA